VTALLEAREVTKIFGGGVFDRSRTVALDNFSMVVMTDPPSITAIVGESGSGKTTLARVLLGLADTTSGDVLYNGKSLPSLSSSEWRLFRRDAQMIFQDPFEVYNPFYKVDHVLTSPVDKLGLASNADEKRKMIGEVLRTVGLRPEETLGRYPHQLSGGQRQRVMVARALLLRPRLIIADEPVSMIDASLRATVLGSLRQLNREFGISIVYITHDLTTAYQISDNIIVLYRGSVAEVGDVRLVVRQPQHPYTRLLVGSIPLPNLQRRWSAEAPPALTVKATDGPRCKFVDRCPSASAGCTTRVPGLYRTDDHRAAACFLYEGSPLVRPEEMDTVLVEPRRSRPATSASQTS
jgi:peptide/nickel transport system ATP-binding protein